MHYNMYHSQNLQNMYNITNTAHHMQNDMHNTMHNMYNRLHNMQR